MNKIDKDKIYSVRESAKLIGWKFSLPIFQRLIKEDMNKENQIFNTIMLKRNSVKRYFIKGFDLISFIESEEYKNIIKNGRLL
jgi:hypothetical protein